MFSRHRKRIILAAVLFLQLLLVAYQVRQDRDIPLIRRGTVFLVTPVQKTFNLVFDGVAGFWYGYVDLRSARRENQELSRELDHLRLEHLRLQNQAEQAKRLQVLLELKGETPSESVAAQVISFGASQNAHLLILDRGRDAGLRPDMPVIVPEGILGKILHVFPSAAQVLLLTETESGVAVLLENSRVHGVLKGKHPELCTLQYVSNDEEVAVGDRLFTSGEDRIYPKGLPVGVVVEARRGETFQEILVRPFAKLNRLEEVLVLVKKVDVEPSAAADKVAELPSEAPESKRFISP